MTDGFSRQLATTLRLIDLGCRTAAKPSPNGRNMLQLRTQSEITCFLLVKDKGSWVTLTKERESWATVGLAGRDLGDIECMKGGVSFLPFSFLRWLLCILLELFHLFYVSFSERFSESCFAKYYLRDFLMGFFCENFPIFVFGKLFRKICHSRKNLPQDSPILSCLNRNSFIPCTGWNTLSFVFTSLFKSSWLSFFNIFGSYWLRHIFS